MGILWIVLAYLAGSFPTGYLAARLFRGVDIRTVGSGNVGATNVGRLMGRKWAMAVALADMVKGAVGLLLARASGVTDHSLLALAAVAGVCGHNFPVWLRFRGGKGVSTTFGVVFFMNPPASFLVAAAGGIVWATLFRLEGYVSLASLAALYCLPLFSVLLSLPGAYTAAMFLLAVLSTLRHGENIRRLMDGKENRFFRGKKQG